MTRRHLYILLCLFPAAPAAGADWFVATDGDNANAGEEASPLATVAEALERAAVGDHIVLRAGTYAEAVDVRKANITIRSYSGEWAHIAVPVDDPAIEQALRFGHEAEQSALLGVEVSGGYHYAVKLDSLWLVPPEERRSADHVTLRESYLHHSGRDVVKLTPGVYGAIIADNTIAHSGQRDDSNAECIDNVNADAMSVYGNHIHDCATNGVYAKGGAERVVIEGNLVRATGAAGILLGYTDTDAAWFDEHNAEYHENIEGHVRNNYVLDTQHAGIALWGSLDAHVYNNTLVDVAQAAQEGILLSEGGPCLPDAGGGCTPKLNPNVNPDIRNNIVVLAAVSTRAVIGSRANGLDCGACVIDFNAYHDQGGAPAFRFDGNPLAAFVDWQAATGQETHSTTGDPELDDTFHLTANSVALVNMGAAVSGVGEDYEGHVRDDGSVDIGADEYLAGAPTLAVPPADGAIGTGYHLLNAPQPQPPGGGDDDGDEEEPPPAQGDTGGGGAAACLLFAVLARRRRPD